MNFLKNTEKCWFYDTIVPRSSTCGRSIVKTLVTQKCLNLHQFLFISLQGLTTFISFHQIKSVLLKALEKIIQEVLSTFRRDLYFWKLFIEVGAKYFVTLASTKLWTVEKWKVRLIKWALFFFHYLWVPARLYYLINID